MSTQQLFAEHITTISEHTEKALALAAELEAAYDGIVFHSGTQDLYHADDHPIPFRPVPHFARFAPVAGPEHLLVFRPGSKPKLFQVVPRDFWYEPAAEPDHPYAEVLDVVQVASRKEAAEQMGDVSRCAYIGNNPRAAAALKIPLPHIEPKTLLAALDWYRAFKTPYEVECIREAARGAARGHRVVREGFATKLTERRLHAAYLEATGLLELETPYSNIIAWDDCSATLHYQTKRASRPDPGAVLLIDAGSARCGYASDITRTYANDDTHPVFREALDRMDDMQQQLVTSVGPGRSYIDVHARAHRGVAEILCDLGVLKTDAADAFERKLTHPFFPHGVGHHLGLQVHDVGGQQVNPQGERRPPSDEHPFLRTTRELDVGHVVTIEPGLYFIPMLLEQHHSSDHASAFDWKLIDALIPFGGIRVEDDVLVTSDGFEDLTRPHVPGHRDS
ncbi:MAG: Xaa-Pro dipeptidase [Candidatus Krumholzibacteriia bacterium]